MTAIEGVDTLQGVDYIMENIQLIIEYEDTSDEEILAKIGIIKYRLPIIGACVLELPESSAKYLKGVGSIKAVYETSNITAQSEGLTGKDINIAILDTGLCPAADFTKPTNRLIAFKDFVNGREDYYDDNGHGTHVWRAFS